MFTVGGLLHSTRNKKNISLPQAAKETRIQLKYLQAVEKNDWDAFTSKVYISGVLRTYASYLGLEPSKVIAYFRRDYEKKEELRFRKRLPSLNFLPETKKIVIGAMTLIMLFFSVYFGYQFYLYLAPPEVIIVAPGKSVFRNVTKVNVVGKTQKEATIRIYNDEVFPDKEGVFEYEFPLKKGKNTISIHVTGANGKKTTITKEYTLE